MDFPYGETVVRQRAVAISDPYSGASTGEDWTTPTTVDLLCAVADGGSLEPVEAARNAVDSDFDVLAPFGSDIRSSDRLVIRGLVCEVAGRPFDWHHPMTGWEPGMVVRAKIREG